MNAHTKELKNYFYIFLFLITCFYSQGQRLDSLKLALKNFPESKRNNPEDTTECQLLIELAQASENESEEEMQRYWMLVKDVSEKKIKELPASHRLQKTFIGYLSFAYNDLGLLYRERGDVVTALEYFHNSLKLDREIGVEEQMGVDYNNIALVYYDIGDKDKAVEYFEKSLSIVEKSEDKRGHAYSLLNVGFIYYTKNNLAKAFDYFNKSLALAKEIKNETLESRALNNLGLIYAKRGDYKTSMEHHLRSLEISKKLNEEGGMPSCLANIGECYKLQHKYKEALNYTSESLRMSRKLNNVETTRRAALLLKEINESLGKYQEALKMYELYIQMRDSTNNINTRKAGLKKQFEYEYEKKEIVLREGQARLTTLYQQKQKFYFIISTVLIILLIILCISFYFWYKFKKEKESKNLHIELKELLQQEIKEKEIIANSLIHIQEKEREKLAAELHDGVNQLLFAAKIQLQASKSVEENMHKDAIKLIENAIGEIKSIARNQGSFLLTNKSLKDALSDLILKMKGNKNLEITFLNYGLDESLLQQEQKTNVLRIIQELLNNAVKHANAKNCYISMKTSRNRIIFSVSDNGTGFDSKLLRDGNGLKNISNKVKLMNGIQKTFSVPGKGSRIYIQLPIS